MMENKDTKNLSVGGLGESIGSNQEDVSSIIDIEAIDKEVEYKGVMGVLPVILGLLTVIGVYQFLKACINLETIAMLSIVGVGILIIILYSMPIISIATIVYLKDKMKVKTVNKILFFGIILSLGEGISLILDISQLGYNISEDKVSDIVKVLSGLFLIISAVVQYYYYDKFIREHQSIRLRMRGIKNITNGYIVNYNKDRKDYMLYLIMLMVSIIGSLIYSYFFLYNKGLLTILPMSGGLLLVLFFASIIGAFSINLLNKYDEVSYIDKSSIISIVITMVQFTTLVFYDGVDFKGIILTEPNLILQLIGGLMLFISLILQAYFIDKVMRFRKRLKEELNKG